jgi:uncharacterized protein
MALDSKIRIVELGLIGVTGVTFLAIPKPPAAVVPMAAFIVSCMTFWGLYLVVRVYRNRVLLDQWGLRPTRFVRELARFLTPVVVVAVLAGAVYAAATERPLWPAWIGVSLLLYPAWGLVQQWLVQSLLVDNVRALTGARLPWLMVLGAVGFGAVHVAHPKLVVATALVGAVYVWLFQRWRNLWPLAVCHGVLGSFFYPWVLGISPTADIMAFVAGAR